MTLYQGATEISAVYYGAPSSGLGVTYKMITYEGATPAFGPSTISLPPNQQGDLILWVTWANAQVAIPSGFSTFKTLSGNGKVGAIYYCFAPQGGIAQLTLANTIGATATAFVFRGVSPTTPFGAYANKSCASGEQLAGQVPGFTMTTPNGYGLALQLAIGNGVSIGTQGPSGYSYTTMTGNTNCAGYFRHDRTTAVVPVLPGNSITASTAGNQAHSFELIAEQVVSTPPLANAVYLGSEKVWPIYVGNLSQWYTPALGSFIDVPWPFGAEFCDVVLVGGGAGGEGTGVAGNPQKGGGAGVWNAKTISRVENGRTWNKIRINNNGRGGNDGVGGGNFNTEAADGCPIVARGCDGVNDATYGDRNYADTGSAQNKTSTNGTRNGGNVVPTFTFNGRTYTVASYGANAGLGGASSNKNGSQGYPPGGGGQSADNGGLTGYNGGNGATGAAILYWY